MASFWASAETLCREKLLNLITISKANTVDALMTHIRLISMRFKVIFDLVH